MRLYSGQKATQKGRKGERIREGNIRLPYSHYLSFKCHECPILWHKIGHRLYKVGRTLSPYVLMCRAGNYYQAGNLGGGSFCSETGGREERKETDREEKENQWKNEHRDGTVDWKGSMKMRSQVTKWQMEAPTVSQHVYVRVQKVADPQRFPFWRDISQL